MIGACSESLFAKTNRRDGVVNFKLLLQADGVKRTETMKQKRHPKEKYKSRAKIKTLKK